VLVGTTLEVSIFLFEVPTGIVADMYSRRLSIIIGFVLIGVGFLFEGSIPAFWAVLVSQVLWGIGYTFTSGATEAWITDEIGEDNAAPLFLRSGQLGNLAGIVATVIAVVIGNFLLNLPILMGGVLFLLMAVFMLLYMPESGFKATPRENRSNWGQMGHTFQNGFRRIRTRPVLLAIMGIGLFIGLYSEGYDRLGTAHLLESFTLPQVAGLQPVFWIGIIGICGQFLTALGLRVAEKRLDMTRERTLGRGLLGANALVMLALFGFALAGNFVLAVIMTWLIGIGRALQGPLETAWMNRHIDSNVRATVISMRGQVDAIGQIVGGPPVGFIGERLGIRAALTASGLILSPAVYLYARILSNHKEVANVAVVEEGTAV
jgi:DHA3 family tetracycline resistance protein-like MFS transporter